LHELHTRPVIVAVYFTGFASLAKTRVEETSANTLVVMNFFMVIRLIYRIDDYYRL
jgi:hypothetical protein